MIRVNLEPRAKGNFEVIPILYRENVVVVVVVFAVHVYIAISDVRANGVHFLFPPFLKRKEPIKSKRKESIKK